LLGFVHAPHASDADDLLQQVGAPDDTADERIRSPASLRLVGRGTAGGAEARGIFYRRAALMA
jgi:hypothetical protein